MEVLRKRDWVCGQAPSPRTIEDECSGKLHRGNTDLAAFHRIVGALIADLPLREEGWS